MNRSHRSSSLTRRQLLQFGGIGILGLSLPQLLQARATAQRRSGSQSEKSCIFIVQYGGASHIDSWDPKPHAPDGIRGPYRPIATRVPGMRLGELHPRLANLADRFCLIRSMRHRDGGHNGAMHICMTGHSRPVENTPYFGSVVAKLRPATRNIPSYVWLQNLAGDVRPRYLTGGFLGAAYSPLRVGHDLDNPSNPNFRFRSLDPSAGVTLNRLRGRAELWSALRGDTQSNRAGEDMRHFQQRALELVTGPEARQAFDLSQEPDGLRERYGRGPLGQNLLMARRLIEAGVRLVSVVAWAGTPPGQRFRNVQTWDMHGGGLGDIFGTGAYGLGWALPRVNVALSALLDDLEVRGLLDSTLVVTVGEFGRTPRINRNRGRDHWPHAYTALLAGAGIRGGAVYGASDGHGAYVRDNPVSPEDFGATLFHALGIDPGTRLGADGFTHPASTGRPIFDLFG